jgi:DNA repair exonuclease SbcCD ATPase subunit
MAEQARVTSIDALESFRASIILFLNTAHQHLDAVGDDVRRMRGWVQNEQRLHWEGELRRRRQKLELAEQELFSAKLSALRENLSAQENAVRKAKAALAEAEEKLRNVKQWTRNFDHCADPLIKRLEGLRQLLDHDMPKAISYLLQAQKTLEGYSESAPSTPLAPAPPRPDEEP